MKNYDINIYWGRATLEITIQSWDFKGHYKIEQEGNIKGADFLENAFETEWLENRDIKWNDCKLEVQENFDGDMIFTAELENEKGDILAFDGTMEELKDYIVGVQITDYIEIEK